MVCQINSTYGSLGEDALGIGELLSPVQPTPIKDEEVKPIHCLGQWLELASLAVFPGCTDTSAELLQLLVAFLNKMIGQSGIVHVTSG